MKKKEQASQGHTEQTEQGQGDDGGMDDSQRDLDEDMAEAEEGASSVNKTADG